MRENLKKALPQIKRILSAGLAGHGKGYKRYLLLIALLGGLSIFALKYGMEMSWLYCHSNYVGLLEILCVTQGWLFPLLIAFFVMMGTLLGSSFIAGLFHIKRVLKLMKYQRAFELIGLKNSKGDYPYTVDLYTKENDSEWLTVKTAGIGMDRFQEKKKDLESALGLSIDSIEQGVNPSFVRLSLYGFSIPKLCEFEKLKNALKVPYTFLVGESAQGTLIQDIASLPHLLIGGTTGGGKSVFFKQVLLGLLSSSPRIQMYLFDLKGGVEMNVFSRLPNVEVYRNVTDSITALQVINDEMDRRLKFLVDHEYSKVDFERDQLDMIVVGVDEASELYGKTSSKKEKEMVEKARELTDRITKLARATGIHVILATQKVVKETIDTKIQENLGGRMCFKQSTLQGSMTMLGNKMALELPKVPGRAIWGFGSTFTEVQAPYLSDEDLKASLEQIKEDFNENLRKNFKSIVSIVTAAPELHVKPEDISMFEKNLNGG